MNEARASGSVSDWIALCKLNISLPVTLTTFTGFIIFNGKLTANALHVCGGVLLLAASASAINHIIERGTDALMHRTMHRPVASGRISILAASLFAVLLGFAGSVLLLQTGIIPFCLGLFNLFWYTLVYTYLKRITAFAVVPGSFVGAIPPVIGWTAAGGYLFDSQILLVALFFFIGQIPHFWLLMLRYGKEYEVAGLPGITKLLSGNQIKRLIMVWIAIATMSALVFVLFSLVSSAWLSGFIVVIVVIQGVMMSNWFKNNTIPDIKSVFFAVNFFYLSIMLVLIFDALLFR